MQGAGDSAPGSKSQGSSTQAKGKVVTTYESQDGRYGEPQSRALGTSSFNPGGNVGVNKDNLDQRISILQGHNITKSKRLNAANRGVNCGTNARVNTFDNRGIQYQQQQQQQ